jgi:hypothetical protein
VTSGSQIRVKPTYTDAQRNRYARICFCLSDTAAVYFKSTPYFRLDIYVKTCGGLCGTAFYQYYCQRFRRWRTGRYFVFLPDSKSAICIDSELLRESRLELSQNYPNPFNPITIINSISPNRSGNPGSLWSLESWVTELINADLEIRISIRLFSKGQTFHRDNPFTDWNGEKVLTPKMVLMK